MADVVAESCHPQDATPVCQLIALLKRRQVSANAVCYVVRVRYDVEHATREFHHAEGMLESLMCCARVYKVS